MPTTLRALFVDELRDAYDAEKRLVKALRTLASTAHHEKLQQAIAKHLEETLGHVERLEEVFGFIERKPRGKKCEGMVGILEESNSVLESIEDPALRDAAMVIGARRVEHYEMAAYLSLIDLATHLNEEEARAVFSGILEEEMACDDSLAELAEALLPLAGSDDAESEENDDDDYDAEDESLGDTSAGSAR